MILPLVIIKQKNGLQKSGKFYVVILRWQQNLFPKAVFKNDEFIKSILGMAE